MRRRLLQYPGLTEPVFFEESPPEVPEGVAAWSDPDPAPPRRRAPRFDLDLDPVFLVDETPLFAAQAQGDDPLPRVRARGLPRGYTSGTDDGPVGINLDHGDWSVFPVRYGTWGRVSNVLHEIVCG